MCNQVITDSVGIISNTNYPTYDSTQTCNAQVKAKGGLILKAFIIDLAIE
jgi:hypothetical protein